MGFAISGALLAYLLWSVNLAELGALLRGTGWTWIALATVLSPLSLWARARRWWYLFPPDVDPPGLVPATMIGFMVNNVLPLRAGEVVRVWVVARRLGHGFWTTLATLVVERVLDSLAIVLMLAGLLLLVDVPPFFEWAALLLLAADLAAVALLGLLAAAPGRVAGWLGTVVRRWPQLERRFAAGLETFVRGLGGIRRPAHAVPLLVWTVVLWSLQAWGAWMVLRALHLDLPWIAGWTVLAFVGLGVAVPSAPGYVGVFHFAAAKAVEIFGVGAPAVVGYALLLHATSIVPVTLVGWAYLLRERVSLSSVLERRPAALPGTD